MKLVIIALISALLGVSAQADEGRLYDVCNTPQAAAVIALGLRDTDLSTDIEVFNLNMLELTRSKACWTQPLVLPSKVHYVEHYRFEHSDGEGPSYVVIEVRHDDGLRYAVIAEDGVSSEAVQAVAEQTTREVLIVEEILLVADVLPTADKMTPCQTVQDQARTYTIDDGTCMSGE